MTYPLVKFLQENETFWIRCYGLRIRTKPRPKFTDLVAHRLLSERLLPLCFFPDFIRIAQFISLVVQILHTAILVDVLLFLLPTLLGVGCVVRINNLGLGSVATIFRTSCLRGVGLIMTPNIRLPAPST